ncbi:MAG: sodium:solute symporter family protein [Alphaproteobacteria bacterium]
MIDLVVVVAFVLYAVGAGLRARREASRGPVEYFLAGRSLRGWRAGMSMSATQFAADTPLLVMGLVATAGIFGLWRLWIYALAFLLMAFVLAGPWRRSGVLTDAELAELRYGGRGALTLRVLKAVYYGTVVNCAVLAMVMVAAVRIAEVCLPWHLWLPERLHGAVAAAATGLGLNFGASVTGLPADTATANALISIVLILTFTASYALTGGLRGVVATDIVQLALALVGTALYAWYVVAAAGGLSGLPDRVAAVYGEVDAARLLSFGPTGLGDLLVPFLVIVSLQWLFQMNADGTGYLAQRTMACRSDADARWAGLVFTWIQILLRSLLWLVIAVGLLVLYPFTADEAAGDGFTAAREILYVAGIDDLLPAGLRGLVLVGLLAALASTIDTHLNWGASYWSNDVYDRLVCRHWLRRTPSRRELVAVARLSGVAIVLLALAAAAQLDSIQAAWSISLLFGAGIGAVLVLRWLWERVNLQAELGAMAVSLIAAPLLLAVFGTDPETEWLRLGSMAASTTAVALLATLLGPPSEDRVLIAFYRRVRPPGFWRRTAALAGDAPGEPVRALVRGVTAVAVTAASLFLLLVGLGRLTVGAPDPMHAVSWAMVAAGTALVPLWLRAARHRRPASPTHAR